MSYLELINKSSAELTELEKDTKEKYQAARVKENRLAIEEGQKTVMSDEYENAIQERATQHRILQDVEKALKLVRGKEVKEEAKRSLPEKPKAFKSSRHYFDKKEEIEARESEFKANYKRTEDILTELSQQYDNAVLHGIDDEINKLYDELKKAKKDKAIALSKLQSLQNNTKQRVLEDAAMEVFLSRSYISDLFQDEQQALIKKRAKVLTELRAVNTEISQYNAKYQNYVNDQDNIVRDFGVNGTSAITQLYKSFPNNTGTDRSISLN